MFKQIAYPFSTALTVTPTPDAPLWQPAFVPSVPASRGFPWLWVVLLLILGAIVLWWIAQSATRAAQTGLTQHPPRPNDSSGGGCPHRDRGDSAGCDRD
jgi:hypothetical protein